MESKGYPVAVYDIDRAAEQRFMDTYGAGKFEAAEACGWDFDLRTALRL